MVKLIDMSLGMAVGVVGGLLASVIFTRVWRLVSTAIEVFAVLANGW